MRAVALALVLASLSGGARARTPLDVLARPDGVVAQVFVLPKDALESGFYERLREAGAHAVALRAFHRLGDRPHEGRVLAAPAGAYFQAPHVAVVADILPAHVEAAREAGLVPLAWMTTLTTPLREDASGHVSLALDAATGEAVPLERLDPFDPTVGRVLADVYAALAATGVEGIVVQDDLMLRQLEGVSSWGLRAWAVTSGREVHPSALYAVDGDRVVPGDGFESWVLLKHGVLADLALRLRSAAQAVRPGLVVVQSLHSETATRPDLGLRWYAESVASVDEFPVAVMGYEQQTARETGVAPETAGEAVAANVRQWRLDEAAQPIAVKVQTIDWTTRAELPVDAIAAAVLRQRPGAVFLSPADDPERVRAILESAARLAAGPAGARLGR